MPGHSDVTGIGPALQPHSGTNSVPQAFGDRSDGAARRLPGTTTLANLAGFAPSPDGLQKGRAMSAGLRIQLLGGFHAVRPDGAPIALGSGRLQELLAFLILHREARQPRHRIAFLFWPDSTEPQALTNLRQLLHALRRTLPESVELVETRRRTLRWAPQAPAEVDVVALGETLTRALEAFHTGDGEAAVRWGREAASRYRGDLLPDCYAPWIEPLRRELRERTGAGLELLIHGLESRRDMAEAVRWARRLVEMDPLREAAHRTLIRIQARAGEPAGALRSYRALE